MYVHAMCYTVLYLNFTLSNNIILESDGYVPIGITLSGGISTTPITVIVTPTEQSPISATGTCIKNQSSYSSCNIFTYYVPTGWNVDFDSEQFNMTIYSGEVFEDYNLSIACDKVVEDEESFNLTFSLANENDQIVIGQFISIIHIIDSTGKSEALLSHY